MRQWFDILLFCASLALVPSPARAQTPIAITHVTVIDGTGAKPKADRTVVVVKDRITPIPPD